MTIQENMNQDITNISKVDLTKIQCIQQKRTLAFINHFVLTNVQFLNNFMKNCEYKLMQFEKKLEKVNASLVLLEAKLSSIPELAIPLPKQSTEEKIEDKPTETKPQDEKSDKELQETKLDEEEKEAKYSEIRPEYERFIKMVNVGVPIPAVKLKIKQEGLDPDVFEGILISKKN